MTQKYLKFIIINDITAKLTEWRQWLPHSTCQWQDSKGQSWRPQELYSTTRQTQETTERQHSHSPHIHLHLCLHPNTTRHSKSHNPQPTQSLSVHKYFCILFHTVSYQQDITVKMTNKVTHNRQRHPDTDIPTNSGVPSISRHSTLSVNLRARPKSIILSCSPSRSIKFSGCTCNKWQQPSRTSNHWWIYDDTPPMINKFNHANSRFMQQNNAKNIKLWTLFKAIFCYFIVQAYKGPFYFTSF